MTALMSSIFATSVYAQGNPLMVDREGSKGEVSTLSKEHLSEIDTLEDGVAKGTITVTLTDGKAGTSKENVKFSLLKVADVVDGEYKLDSQYTITQDLNSIKNAKDLEQASTELANVAAEGTVKSTDANGVVSFSDLELGVYLLKGMPTKSYDDITPTLLAIPTWDAKKGDMSYELTVKPKHTPKPDEEQPPIPAPQTGIGDVINRCIAVMCVGVLGLVLLEAIKRYRYEKNQKE